MGLARVSFESYFDDETVSIDFAMALCSRYYCFDPLGLEERDVGVQDAG